MNRKPAFALVLGLVALTGAWILKISTPFGLGLTDDAISYIAASRALLAGQGFTRIWLATGLEPITHWPPAFPATLAFISLITHLDPYRSARILNGLVFGFNAALLALLGYKMFSRSKGFVPYISGLFLALLFLSNTALLRLHAQALSEPLYLFISLLAFLAFYKAFENSPKDPKGFNRAHIKPFGSGNRQRKWLILAGFLTGLSYLTRYAALSLLATFIVAIFILTPSWRKRFTSLGSFLLGALPPILAWMGRNKIVGGSATNRRIEWHPLTIENAQRGLKTFFSFLIPWQELRINWIENYSLLAIILFIIIFALLFWLLRHGVRYFFKPEENRQPEIIPFLTGLYIFSYMGSLFISLSYFDAATPLNNRILSPVYVAFFILWVYFIHRLAQQGKILSRIFAYGLSLSLLIIFVAAQIQTIRILEESPTGFASWRWRESVVIEEIRNLPEGVQVYTNQPTALYFWTKHPVYRLWDEQPDALRSGDAVLAIFFPPEHESPEFQAWFAEMTKGLEPIQKSGLGNLYQKTDK